LRNLSQEAIGILVELGILYEEKKHAADVLSRAE